MFVFSLDVLHEVVLESRPMRAHGACKGLFPRVCQHMVLQVLLPIATMERLAAHGARTPSAAVLQTSRLLLACVQAGYILEGE